MTKGEETRSSVLDTALSLATQVGLEGLTIGKLAEHVGMSKSGLFAHFTSKENLQVAVLDQAKEKFIALVVTPALKKPRGEPRLRALFEMWLAWSKEYPGGCIFVVAGVELDDKPGPARDRFVAVQRDWLSTLRQAAQIAVDEGHLAPGTDCAQMAFEFFAIAHGYHFVRRISSEDAAERSALQAFDRLLAFPPQTDDRPRAAARPPRSPAPSSEAPRTPPQRASKRPRN